QPSDPPGCVRRLCTLATAATATTSRLRATGGRRGASAPCVHLIRGDLVRETVRCVADRTAKAPTRRPDGPSRATPNPLSPGTGPRRLALRPASRCQYRLPRARKACVLPLNRPAPRPVSLAIERRPRRGVERMPGAQGPKAYAASLTTAWARRR